MTQVNYQYGYGGFTLNSDELIPVSDWSDGLHLHKKRAGKKAMSQFIAKKR